MKPNNSRPVIYVVIAIMITLVLAGLFLYLQTNRSSQPKAAIIDQLSSSHLTNSFPNETFTKTAKEVLNKRFPHVEYYSDNATIDQYAHLPSLGYGLIIWRVHSALDEEGYFVAICSSERYDPEKYRQYSADQLTLCNITGDTRLYFAITPEFIKECMNGRFEDTVIVFMSCNGLKERFHKTAEALIEKGAKVFISWDGWIEPSNNDHAIALLLDYLINENNTIRDAVGKVPKYSYMGVPCELNFYPHETSEFRIPEHKQDKTSSTRCNVALALTASRRKSKARRCSSARNIS